MCELRVVHPALFWGLTAHKASPLSNTIPRRWVLLAHFTAESARTKCSVLYGIPAFSAGNACIQREATCCAVSTYAKAWRCHRCVQQSRPAPLVPAPWYIQFLSRIFDLFASRFRKIERLQLSEPKGNIEILGGRKRHVGQWNHFRFSILDAGMFLVKTDPQSTRENTKAKRRYYR